jgi:Fe-S oxidoreductase
LLAEKSFLIAEFLSQEQAAGRLRLPLHALPQRHALVHGHCHEKAFDVLDATRRALQLVPGLSVDAITSSCCGMAGSFGYEAKHYDISMRMAELSLLPAVRRASYDTLLVANGTSCRHQIADGTRGPDQRKAEHMVRVLERALEPERRTGEASLSRLSSSRAAA